MSKKSTKLIRCKGMLCKHKEERCGWLHQLTGFTCSRKKGHKGNHIACCEVGPVVNEDHNLKVWR